MKQEPGFMYRTLKLSAPCYNAIKMMLVHQMNEQKAAAVKMDGTIGTVTSNSLVATMLGSDTAAKMQAVAGMFQKVEAGKEV